MTVTEMFGCAFIAFGPPLALFIFTIATDPLRVIVLMASAFFWLLSLLLSSILWFAVVPLREQLAFGLVFSVIFQEAFRFVFYILIKKADKGLKQVSEREGMTGMTIVSNQHLMAYVSGLGYGIISGAFSLVNILADMSGPGTIGLFGDPGDFFIASAFLTLAFILLHIFWGILFHAGLNEKKYWMPVIVGLSHMLVSCMTLLNQGTNPLYWVTEVVAYASVVAMGIWAFFVAGGSLAGLKSFFSREDTHYSVQ